MGKFRTKLKGQTKGKRWPKGQSSSCNPETQKHRDLARSKFFQANLGGNTLTSDALRKHDAIEHFRQDNDRTTDMETESSVGSQHSFGTMKSFASEWSNCTSMSFNRFFKIFKADSALHKEMLAVLAAITEVIKEKNGTESATEYFCGLMVTLATLYNVEEKNEDQITAVLALLNMGIKTVPEGVLRAQYDKVLGQMLHILCDYVNADNNRIIKSVFGILGVLLRKQELTVWTNQNTIKLFANLLNPFCIHTKPKWRKAAQEAVISIIKAEYFEKSAVNVAADKLAEFCEQTLQESTTGKTVSTITAGQTTILHTLGLMKEGICYFSKGHLKASCELLLKLLTLNYPIVTTCSLHVIHSLFSTPKPNVVPQNLNQQLILALYDFQPGKNDAQPTLAWLAVMQQAHIYLTDTNIAAAANILPRIVNAITRLWLSEKKEITAGATHALEILIKDAIVPICESDVISKENCLEQCFNSVKLGLGYQYNVVWSQVLHIIGIMFEVAGSMCAELLADSLATLAELRDSYKFSYNHELEHAVGAAVRSMGPEIVLNVISLKRENGDLNSDRSWMLPVLKENIKISTLDYFVKGILPLALYCQRRSRELAERNDGIGAHSSELLHIQLWNLLPCFCNNASDISDNFKSIAKVLGSAISERKELRLAVMASLRRLINSAKEAGNEVDAKELARFDKNYLPILFNVYTTKPIGSDEEGQRLAALDTIKVYLSIANGDLAQQLLTHAIERLNSSSEDPEDYFIKESIFDLIRALIPYQKFGNIETVYEQCVKNLPQIKNNKEQKKAYRLLEEMCSCESDDCKQFLQQRRREIQSLLWKSLESAAVSSKGARLRCMNYLIRSQPQLDSDSKVIKRVLPEAVLACKDLNEKTRRIAYELLNTVGEILQTHDQLDDFVKILAAGLGGHSTMISCTILALASVLHNFSGALGQKNIQWILDRMMELLQHPSREIVGPCLSFIKVYCKSMQSPQVGAVLPQMVKGLATMTDDCRRHFRLKVRDILNKLYRKYGSEAITPHIPLTDSVMYKQLRNIRKINARKQRTKDDSDDEDDEEEFTIKKNNNVNEILADSESELDDMETDQAMEKKKKQPKTWIQEDAENIVDFTDPNVASKITATKPGTSKQEQGVKKNNRGFKTASDGRLIIEEDSSDSETGKKNKFSFDSDSDSDVDEHSVAETLDISDRKRKRAASSVKSGFSEPPAKYKPGGVGIHRNTDKTPGADYKGKKAKGDVKKKGKVEPYAYVPLRRSAMNKRKKIKAAGQFNNLIKAAKVGAMKGAKNKKKKQ